MPKECTTIEFSSNEGIISHNILTKYKKKPLNYLEDLYFIIHKFDCKVKKDSRVWDGQQL